jgi:hypothetical protein
MYIYAKTREYAKMVVPLLLADKLVTYLCTQYSVFTPHTSQEIFNCL